MHVGNSEYNQEKIIIETSQAIQLAGKSMSPRNYDNGSMANEPIPDSTSKNDKSDNKSSKEKESKSTKSTKDKEKNGNLQTNSSNLNINPISMMNKRKSRQIENLLDKKVVSINDLKKYGWKGIPFGK